MLQVLIVQCLDHSVIDFSLAPACHQEGQQSALKTLVELVRVLEVELDLAGKLGGCLHVLAVLLLELLVYLDLVMHVLGVEAFPSFFETTDVDQDFFKQVLF